MANKELLHKLFDKMFDEQTAFKKELEGLTPGEIMSKAAEFAMRERILEEMENIALSDERALALISSENALGEVYEKYFSIESERSDVVIEVVEACADEINQRREAHLKPMYQHDGGYAAACNEAPEFWESHYSNAACKTALDGVIEKHYDGYDLDRDAVNKVIAEYGLERTAYVVALTIQAKGAESRVLEDNMTWANTVSSLPSVDPTGQNRRYELMLNWTHPGVLNILANIVQEEFAIRQPVYLENARYAREHGEMGRFRASNRANILCQKEIEAAITRNWDGTRLAPDAVKGIVERFGVDRVSYLLAVTLQGRSWDERISPANMEWAKSFFESVEERRRGSIGIESHSAKLDDFVSQFRAQNAVILSARDKKQAVEEMPDRGDGGKPSIKAQLAAAKSARKDHAQNQPRSRGDNAR